jgi:hypothetical protein
MVSNTFETHKINTIHIFEEIVISYTIINPCMDGKCFLDRFCLLHSCVLPV